MSGVVEVRDLFRVYPSAEGGVAALQGLTLSVGRGELCVVLGPSGSGKSTLLRIVAAFDRPSAGSVTVAGTDVAALGSWAAGRFRSRSIGYADQHYWRALAGELTARELVGVQLGLAGVARGERERRADELLERVGLAARRHAHPRQLSGGEQQRVALCAAVAGQPDLLIADEPTGELDAATAREVLAVIAELVRSEGSTALVVSHDPASAERADRVVHVRDGRVSSEHVAGAAAAGDGAIVVGRGGWLRLPEDLLRSAGIHERAVAHLEPGAAAVVVAAPAAASEPRVSETQAPLAPRNEAVAASEEGASGSETQAPLVEARGLVRGFGGGVTPIAGLTASFAPGTVTVVTGPSGSGKTTLLHLLAGLDLPDAGEVVVDGVSLGSLDRGGRAELRRTRVAFVAQEAGLVPFLGARENVELALALRRVEGDADAVLEAVGLAEHAERPVAELSAGQRVRAALARALAPRPLVLLADEPTARLDAANALALGTLLAELARERGTTVICATHDPLLIEQAGAELPLRSA
ncbi:MAG TPA: ATP-binding cassette domain-containing protein [Gaiellaceae bacterium]